MNKLIELDSVGKLTIQPEALAITAYKNIWDRDKSKDKTNAIKELTCIYFLRSLDKTNPYKEFHGKDRITRLKDDLMSKEWKPDAIFNAGVEQYEKHNYNATTEFLISALKGAMKLREFFDGLDMNQVDTNGRPVWKPKDITGALKEAGGVIKSLKELQKQEVEDKSDASGRIRGNGKKGLFEEITDTYEV